MPLQVLQGKFYTAEVALANKKQASQRLAQLKYQKILLILLLGCGTMNILSSLTTTASHSFQQQLGKKIMKRGGQDSANEESLKTLLEFINTKDFFELRIVLFRTPLNSTLTCCVFMTCLPCLSRTAIDQWHSNSLFFQFLCEIL